MQGLKHSSPRAARWIGFGLCVSLAFAFLSLTGPWLSAAEPGESGGKADAKVLALGREMFLREWVPNDQRSHGGDGLGPVFNDSSCVACHNLGGAGGAGPANKNVEIISASSPQFGMDEFVINEPLSTTSFLISLFGGTITVEPEAAQQRAQRASEARARQQKSVQRMLESIHPGFAGSKSVVLHRFGLEPAYANWRTKFNGFGFPSFASFDPVPLVHPAVRSTNTRRFEQIQRARVEINHIKSASAANQFTKTSSQGNITVTATQRNPIALFGIGLIDSIPDKVIEQAAEQKHPEFPGVSGRVSRLKDGHIGRFGWKAQKPTLREFALTACAVEVGLDVPGHPQSGNPLKPDYQAPGPDMNDAECNALVTYLAHLPAPVRQASWTGGKQQADFIGAGHSLFMKIGCAECHSEGLGEVSGLYSDLLVHDMGPDMVDTGDYGVFSPGSPGDTQELNEITETTDENGKTETRIVGASQLEWRTPALWGCRDSAPYLHDGRAQTLTEAIAFHGGEGSDAAINFFILSPLERQQVVAFLKSLAAPGEEKLASLR